MFMSTAGMARRAQRACPGRSLRAQATQMIHRDPGHHGAAQGDCAPDRQPLAQPRPGATGGLGTRSRHRTAPELRADGQGGRRQGGPLCTRQAVAAHAPRDQAAAHLAGPRHP